MKSKILDAVHQTATGLHKSGAITDDTESFLVAVTGKLDNDFPDDITDDDLGIARKPGARSGLPRADADWDSQDTNAGIAQTLSKDRE